MIYFALQVSWVSWKSTETRSSTSFWPCCSHRCAASSSRRTSNACWSKRGPWPWSKRTWRPSCHSETGSGCTCGRTSSRCCRAPRRRRSAWRARPKRSGWPRWPSKRPRRPRPRLRGPRPRRPLEPRRSARRLRSRGLVIAFAV